MFPQTVRIPADWRLGMGEMKKSRGLMRRLLKSTAGDVAVEYALLLGLVAAIAGFGMLSMGDSLGNKYRDFGDGIADWGDIFANLFEDDAGGDQVADAGGDQGYGAGSSGTGNGNGLPGGSGSGGAGDGGTGGDSVQELLNAALGAGSVTSVTEKQQGEFGRVYEITFAVDPGALLLELRTLFWRATR